MRTTVCWLDVCWLDLPDPLLAVVDAVVVVVVTVDRGGFVSAAERAVDSDSDADGSGDASSFVQPARDPAATTATAIATRWSPVMPRRVAAAS